MKEKDRSLFEYNGKTYKLVKQPKEVKSCRELCSLYNYGCEKLCVKAYNELDNPDFGLIEAVFVEVDEAENKETDMKNDEIDYKVLYEETISKLKIAKKNVGCCTFSSIIDKVIPELAESEDEKIRKELIEFFNQFENGELRGVDITPWIAWLEKQGHDGKKWIYEDVYLKEKEKLFQDGIDEVLENPQKYGLEKQNSSEYEKGPEIKDDVLSRFAFYQYDNDTIYLSSLFVRESDRGRGYGSKVLKAAEEVAKTFEISKICLKVERNTWMEKWYKKNGFEYISSEGKYNWLEKQVESKPTWSEEDDILMNGSINYLCNLRDSFKREYDKEAVQTCIYWIKSLLSRFNPTILWRPTEEQMIVLEDAAREAEYKQRFKEADALRSLDEDLKKL